MIEGFDGSNELESTGKKGGGGGGGGKRLFTLRLLAPSKEDGSIPREIDAFLKSLRNHPLWVRDFLSVEITDIKRAQAKGTTTPMIGFTILCSPKNALASGGPAPAARAAPRVRRNTNDSIGK